MKSNKRKKTEKRFTGQVVSAKMDKTIVVAVSTIKIHPKYSKRYRRDKKYKVHDEKNQYKAGDVVQFVNCKPYSREKKWKVVSDKKAN